jgi:hypothetical protein
MPGRSFPNLSDPEKFLPLTANTGNIYCQLRQMLEIIMPGKMI